MHKLATGLIALVGTALIATTAAAEAPKLDTSSKASKTVRALYATLTCDKANALEVDRYDTYCERYAEYMATNRTEFIAKAKPWIAQRRPASLPKTLLYPFSGADLLTSLVVYPDAERVVHLTLDDGGRADALERLDPRRRRAALRTLMNDAAKWLLIKGYNSTDSLRRTMDERLQGMLATVLLGLSVHEGEVVGMRYLRVKDDGSVEYVPAAELQWDKKPVAGLRDEFESFELHYKLPGSDKVRVFQHVWANLGNRWLEGKGAGVLKFTKNLGQVAFLTKANEYNIWRPPFSVIRDVALDQARWMISDSSGVASRHLAGTPWEAEVYGTFLCDKANMRNKIPGLHKVNDEMVEYWAKHSKGELAFRFGYGDCRGNNHIMMHQRRDAADAR